ncbi:AbrB/MazE/SpoVT family DNA-binding domain-containing protein [Thermus thalpophilus]
MVKSKVSSKGQITLPKAVREALGLQPGEEVIFELREEGALIRPRRRVPLEALVGSLRKRPYPGDEAERRAREVAWAEGS